MESTSLEAMTCTVIDSIKYGSLSTCSVPGARSVCCLVLGKNHSNLMAENQGPGLEQGRQAPRAQGLRRHSLSRCSQYSGPLSEHPLPHVPQLPSYLILVPMLLKTTTILIPLVALSLKGSAGRLFCSHLRSWEVAADWRLGRESPGGSLKCWDSWGSLRTVLSCGLSGRTVHLTAVQASPVPLKAEPRTGAA